MRQTIWGKARESLFGQGAGGPAHRKGIWAEISTQPTHGRIPPYIWSLGGKAGGILPRPDLDVGAVELVEGGFSDGSPAARTGTEEMCLPWLKTINSRKYRGFYLAAGVFRPILHEDYGKKFLVPAHFEYSWPGPPSRLRPCPQVRQRESRGTFETGGGFGL